MGGGSGGERAWEGGIEGEVAAGECRGGEGEGEGMAGKGRGGGGSRWEGGGVEMGPAGKRNEDGRRSVIYRKTRLEGPSSGVGWMRRQGGAAL